MTLQQRIAKLTFSARSTEILERAERSRISNEILKQIIKGGK